MPLEWIIGTIVLSFAGISGILYRKSDRNETRLNQHAVAFAEISHVPESLKSHERREEKIFDDILEKIADIEKHLLQLSTDMAVVKKFTNGRTQKEN